MSSPTVTAPVLIDDPAQGVRRVTLNRAHKRNALDGPTRQALLAALRAAAEDPGVRVAIVAGDGPDFCAGYDLAPAAENKYGQSGSGPGRFQREVVEGWLSLAQLPIPVIAQVHGNCLAGGSELAVSCDLVYVARDAKIGYPAVRFGVPDLQFHAWWMGPRRAMEAVLTGDTMTGEESVTAGYANRAFAADELAAQVLEVAARIARIDPEIVQLNKRSVHRAMESMGMPAAVRSGTDASALAVQTGAFTAFMESASNGVRDALDTRDQPFGDGRTGGR